MRKQLIIPLLILTFNSFGQESETKHSYILLNPFNAVTNQIAITCEKRNGQNGPDITLGYIYQRHESALKSFGNVPVNYIIANTFYAYKGFLLYPGYNHYLKNRDSYFGIKGVFKYMFHDSLDLKWEWMTDESFVRRVQSDKLLVMGAELLYGVKKDLTQHLFFELFSGIGFRFKLHHFTVYDSYLDSDPLQHQDPAYPFNQNVTLIKPTVHLGINIGLKL
jgi:hypothetical protein